MKNTFIPHIALAAALFAAAPLRAQAPPAPQVAHSAPAANTPSPQAWLVFRPWRFIGDRSYAERVFAADGTFKTIGIPDQAGSWAVTPDGVTLTYADGHRDAMSLPLNPAGTDCVDENDRHFTAIIGKIIPVGASSVLDPHSVLDSNTSLDANPLDSQDTPRNGRQGRGNRQPKPADPLASAAPASDPFADLPPSAADQKQNALTIALLTSAPWKILGQASFGTYVFDAAGSIYNPRGNKPTGAWQISGSQLRLSFEKGGIEILDLPLDPKGTDGADSHGIPIIALQQAALPVTARVARAPRATAAPATATPSSTFGASTLSPSATATPATGAHVYVPAHPFGTEQPPQQ